MIVTELRPSLSWRAIVCVSGWSSSLEKQSYQALPLKFVKDRDAQHHNVRRVCTTEVFAPLPPQKQGGEKA